MRRLDVAAATELATRACRAAGAGEAAAQSLARATVDAELQGRATAGFAHLPDYLAALGEGRIDGAAEPILTSPARAIIACDAKKGIAQLGFDRALADLRHRATIYGLALFAGRGSYTTGELGDYVRRPAEAGLIALATTNGPALMAPPGAKRAVYCTNPLAFAAPVDDGPPLLIDQATSATAFVALRRLAENGEALFLEGAVGRKSDCLAVLRDNGGVGKVAPPRRFDRKLEAAAHEAFIRVDARLIVRWVKHHR